MNELSDVLPGPLTMIFNASIQSGIVHQSWKRANIVPIHKSGTKLSVTNYRPVSLMSVVQSVRNYYKGLYCELFRRI